ncbi:PIG-L family deacetylase [Segetibacter sp. 3557_3]|uniref:PIG-L family deacetylase n=1 Tax=Segetibacter sp. 3557_3 TaxID=2547429 RepID=UPI001058FAE0|nr:PIG-L family deacetylase [Segetibacter sp. 3557_3]TDH28946.1 PIG-L family deacetylase [Segetibacter sp. 3557_3]
MIYRRGTWFPFFLFFLCSQYFLKAQIPVVNSSADIYLQLKKLNVLGSVLYVAAHPDDENNGLLPYFAKEKLYRTGYLSLTRGDGGQNLIGSEQGIELGLIRTEELLAARRIDGADQFFTRAYEFGFSKSAAEALKFWGHEKILSDVVWVIRQYQPDVIIKRFPPDARAGHGHHSASAILADEAFTAAADPKRFPEQLKLGVTPWQAKRIVWNTFNFGGANTTSEDQLKIDVGGFNSLLGKSYGELGGEARSMHKSQGEGRPRRRGPVIEYFITTGGEPAKTDLMDGIVYDWSRIKGGAAIKSGVAKIVAKYNFEQPELSVPALVKLYQAIKALPASMWRNKKLEETQEIIEACSGLFSEATTGQPSVVQGDTLRVSFFLNKRKATNATLKNIRLEGFDSSLSLSLGINQNTSINQLLAVSPDKKISQPYWLENPQTEGAFEVNDQSLIGKALSDPSFMVTYTVNIGGVDFIINRPVQYKVVDPAKGELYQPLAILPKVEVNFARDNMVSINGAPVKPQVHFKSNLREQASYQFALGHSKQWLADHSSFSFTTPGLTESYAAATLTQQSSSTNFAEPLTINSADGRYQGFTRQIPYDHIPVITYFPKATANLVKADLKIVGKKVGYITGAGDKVPDALTAMGYEVTFLHDNDVNIDNLKQFDAIVIGIRAHNIYEYLSNKNDILNTYVQEGGNLVVQYMKSNQVGTKRIKVGPYPFSISSGSRVTEEDAKVQFLLPEHPALNYPNKITDKDFEGWVQERSTYQVDQADGRYEKLLGMNDTNEKQGNGSLVIAKYGKGYFAYVSLVLFRQLPAGVPGAYRLMANLVALPKNDAGGQEVTGKAKTSME